MERSDTWRPATDKMLKMSLDSMVGVGIKVCYEPCEENRVKYLYFRTQGNLYSPNTNKNKDNKEEEEERIATDWGWGFCSEECFQSEDEDKTGVLRTTKADIFHEEYCDNALKGWRMEGKNGKKINYKYEPEILCIGKNKSLNFEIYSTPDETTNGSNWTLLEYGDADIVKFRKEIYQRNMIDLDDDGGYVTSVGACKGDSGGPAFTDSKQHLLY